MQVEMIASIVCLGTALFYFRSLMILERVLIRPLNILSLVMDTSSISYMLLW
jgi:hypothetical protein